MKGTGILNIADGELLPGLKTESEEPEAGQGVRWRFNRLANEQYVAAYETIYLIESLFGTELRQLALDIAKERVAMRIKAQKTGNFSRCRRQKPGELPGSAASQ